jgi:hypothetical protein
MGCVKSSNMWIVPKNISSFIKYDKEVKTLALSLHKGVMYRSLPKSPSYFERSLKSKKRYFYSQIVLSSKLPMVFQSRKLYIRKYPIITYRKFSLQSSQDWALYLSGMKTQYTNHSTSKKNLYRTPSMCDIKHCTYKDVSKLFTLIERGKQDSLVCQVHRTFVKRPKEKINTRWVEQCMGLPIGWVLPIR